MAPRRSHKKSRDGCYQCKQRRVKVCRCINVKCDENGPPCSNCIRRALPCTFSKDPSSCTEQASCVNEFCSPTKTNEIEPYNDQAALRDLELMHKFSTETYRSLSNDSLDYHSWQVVVPRKALTCDFLMSGILAIAALHSAATARTAADVSKYIDWALQYENVALGKFRQPTNDLCPMNCDVIFAHSVITAAITLALPRFTAGKGISDPVTSILTIYEMILGVDSIDRLSKSWPRTPFFTSMRGVYWSLSKSPASTSASAALQKVQTVNDEVTNNTDHRDIISKAIRALDYCFQRYEHCEDIATPLSWFAIMDQNFIHLLRDRYPVALMLVVHWGVLLHQLDGKVWWASGASESLIAGLLDLLDPDDTRFKDALEWPRERLFSG